MIKKVTGGYRVVSEKGKNLGGPYKTKKEAEKRLQQVAVFQTQESLKGILRRTFIRGLRSDKSGSRTSKSYARRKLPKPEI